MEETISTELKGIKYQFEALGTLNQLIVYNQKDTELLKQAAKRVLEIDDLMSVFKPDSEISSINRNSGVKEISVSSETIELITLAKEISKISKGAFDITIGPLVQLWGIGKEDQRIPSKEEIKECSKYIDYQDIVISHKKNTVFLKKEKQKIDLGGIAKGYAADEAKRILIDNGVKSAVINLGGNIMLIGEKIKDMPWNIGIQNPLASRGHYVGFISVKDKTVVTSGSNERFFMKNGIRYHHLLDPRTGEPSKSGLLSVTVVCENSTIADALTTAIFVLGMEEGLLLLKTFHAEAVFLTEKGNIYVTEGLIIHLSNFCCRSMNELAAERRL